MSKAVKHHFVFAMVARIISSHFKEISKGVSSLYVDSTAANNSTLLSLDNFKEKKEISP